MSVHAATYLTLGITRLFHHTCLAGIVLLLLLQTSCSWVLKESRSVYKAASEGIMNLADKFFEMERAQALQVGQGQCVREGVLRGWEWGWIAFKAL
jgi:hypothetical protein